jgi:hypothetical protein
LLLQQLQGMPLLLPRLMSLAVLLRVWGSSVCTGVLPGRLQMLLLLCVAVPTTKAQPTISLQQVEASSRCQAQVLSLPLLLLQQQM